LAAGVDRDTDRGCKLARDTSFLCFVRILLDVDLISQKSYLQLGQGETTSSSYTAVVLDGWASDNRSQLVNRSRSDCCSFRETSIAASELSAGLVIVC
jgi:hypothetical protein